MPPGFYPRRAHRLPELANEREAPPPAPPHRDGEGSGLLRLPSPSRWGGAGGGASSAAILGASRTGPGGGDVARMTGKTVIVTGAGHGIGRAYAERLAQEEANLVVADLDGPAAETVAGDINELGGQALPVQVDVADWQSAQSMVARAVERFGAV